MTALLLSTSSLSGFPSATGLSSKEPHDILLPRQELAVNYKPDWVEKLYEKQLFPAKKFNQILRARVPFLAGSH